MQTIKSHITVFLLFVAVALQAQQINKAEYYYDADPGIGKGISIAITQSDSISKSIALPTTGLSVGVHRLYIRVRNTSNKWSIADSRNIFVSPNYTVSQNQITKAEYFFDTDPGVGKGTSLTVTQGDSISASPSINVSALATGLHRIYFRVRNQLGVWSIADSRAFLVLSSTATAIPKINKAEYFIDADPGVGKGTAITVSSSADSLSQNITVNPSSLSIGMHRLYIRVRNTSGNWSIADSRAFTVLSAATTNVPKLNKAEYFFDTDPGVGKGKVLAIPSSQDSILLTQGISVSGLSVGMHRIYFRTRNTNGTWSISDGRPFSVISSLSSTKRRIKKAEYFFDTDPGVGKGTAINTGALADSISISNLNISVSGLSAGAHKVFVRAMDSTNVWSIAQGKTFTTCTSITYPNFTFASGCSGTAITFTNTSTGNGTSTATYTWKFGDGSSDAITTSTTHIFNTAKTFDVTLIASNGGACADTIVKSIVIGNSIGTVSISSNSQPVQFCEGGNVLLQATPSISNVLFQWQKNNADLTGDTTKYLNVITSGTYRCKVTNACGSTYSSTITVTVGTFPIITVTQPASNSICSGASLTLNGSVSGATSQVWYKDGNPIAGATGNSYTVTAAGDYALYATGSCGTSHSSNFPISVVPNVPASVSITSTNDSICPGDPVVFSATPTYGGNAPTYQWRKNGVVISGATLSTYNTSSAANNDSYTVVMTSTENCVSSKTATSNAIVITAINALNAAVSVIATPNNICVGQQVTFTATPIGGGSNPTYQWKLNGNNIAGATASTYKTSTLVNNDLISVVMTSNSACAVGSPATSTPIAIAVGIAGAASVGITPSANNVCEGTFVTFAAQPVNGGSLATYQWKLNGVNVANATQLTYSSSNFVNGDVVSVVMTSSLGCSTGSPATSNAVAMSVVSNVPASVSIASSATTVCSGTSVTFTATPTNGGVNPTYQWKKNGVNISGATASSYTTSSMNDNDVFSTDMTSKVTCAVGNPASSNTITMSVGQSVAADVKITSTSTTICAGQLVTFTANPTGGGNAPTYEWKVNGTILSGLTSAIYSTSSLVNNDQITVKMTSNASCSSGSPVVSAPFIVAVSNSVIAGVNITTANTSICAGAQVTFTATPTNGGSAPSYQWKKNGVNLASEINAALTTANINNLDSITCEMISSSGCATGGAAVSNTLKMLVTQNVIASVSANTASLSVCQGDNVSFYATPASGLSNVSYQWKLNGNAISGATNQIYSSSNLNDADLISVTLTSNDVCASGSPANSNVINLKINKPVVASVAIAASDTILCAGSQVTFTAFPTNGGVTPSYTWTINGVSQIGEIAQTFFITSLNNGDVVKAQLISNAACVSGSPAASNNVTMVINNCTNAIATGSVTGSPFCNNMIFFVPFNSQGTYTSGNIYTAQLSDESGSFASPTNIGTLASITHSGQIICTTPTNAVASNKYRVRVVSNSPVTIGVDNKADLTIISSNFGLDFSADNLKPSNPFVVTFSNKTPDQGDYNFIWYFGDGTNYVGAIPPPHQYIHEGNYSVSVLAIKILTGCSDTLIKSNYISCIGGSSKCAQSVSVSPTGPINGCIGGSTQLTCATDASLPTYQWNINGVTIGGATQSSYLASISGYYSVTVYDNGGCPVTTNLVAVNFNKTAPQAPTISSSGNVLSCAGGTKTLTASSGFANYLWNTGETTQSINVTQSGYYYVTVNNVSNVGCDVNSEIIAVNASSVTAPEICMVTVDTSLGKKGKGYNLIVWEKPVTANIDSFVVYKESTKAGIYKRIGAVDFNDLSEFVDSNSNPKIHADRYKLAARDNCGGITLPSTYHKTMHLQVNPGIGKERNLSWTHEEGIPFSTYKIYRGEANKGLTLIDSISSNNNTYTDLKVKNPKVYYQVQVELPNGGCTSAKSLLAKRKLSQSNVGSNDVIEVANDVGISELNENLNFSIIPNPSNGKFTLRLKLDRAERIQVQILNIAGQTIVSNIQYLQQGEHNLQFELTVVGMYFIQLKTQQGITTNKIIVE